MSTATPLTNVVSGLRFRVGLGMKFFLILMLAFVMSIPGFFLDSLTDGRASNHGVAAASAVNSTAAQPATVLGVRLADSYRSMHRALKYITLFLGLVFLAYFLFEVLSGTRVHLAQVGVAQTVFYLLLLSLAEYVGFDWSYLIAGGATVALFSINAEWVFRSRMMALRALATFSALYAFIYVLLRVEAYALLTGSIASFAAIAAAMYVTRNVDWYGGAEAAPPPPPAAAGGRDSWLR
ncbi:MAG TPA: inner membrane CreD family protein [Acidobacteriaceae bacterium]|nr:inner membrane CreD family protein [Acidobacteriaceae bacterium]